MTMSALVTTYQAGASVGGLTECYQIHNSTVMSHLHKVAFAKPITASSTASRPKLTPTS